MLVSSTKHESNQTDSHDYSHHYSVLSKRETNTTTTVIELTQLGPELALEVAFTCSEHLNLRYDGFEGHQQVAKGK